MVINSAAYCHSLLSFSSVIHQKYFIFCSLTVTALVRVVWVSEFFQHSGVKLILMPFTSETYFKHPIGKFRMFMRDKGIAYLVCLFIQLPFLTIIVIWSWRSTGPLEGRKVGSDTKSLDHPVDLKILSSCSWKWETSNPTKNCVHSSRGPEAS